MTKLIFGWYSRILLIKYAFINATILAPPKALDEEDVNFYNSIEEKS